MARGRICDSCDRLLISPPERLLPGGLRLIAVFEHSGLAADLVKSLKYRGAPGYAELCAERISGQLPRFPLVPVPRALSRYLRYGVDPAYELATVLGRHLGVPVFRALRRPLHTAHRAGRNRSAISRAFKARIFPGQRVILVDDVVTTGSTVLAAARALGGSAVSLAVTANDAYRMPPRRQLTQGRGLDSRKHA